MRMRRDWLYAALPDDPAAPGAGDGGAGGAPPADPGQGGDPPPDPTKDEPPLTWESLAEKGIKNPADVLAVLEDRDRQKGHSRTWEKRATDNKAELDKLRRGSLPDDQRAVEETKDAVRAEIMRTMAPTLGKAAFVAAAAGKVADVESALELIDPARFVKDDGTVDEEAVQGIVAKLAKLGGGSASQNGAGGGGKPPAVERGARNGGRPTQLSRADLERMSPDEINKARKEGRLDDLLGIKR